MQLFLIVLSLLMTNCCHASCHNESVKQVQEAPQELLSILIPQKNNQPFSTVWNQATNKKDKSLAITYLASAVYDQAKKEGLYWNIIELINTTKKFINDHKEEISEYAREQALERMDKLRGKPLAEKR